MVILIGFPQLTSLYSMQATNEVITRVPCSTQDEMNSAVKAALDTFPAWSDTSVMTRQRVMFNLQHLIRENMVLCVHWCTYVFVCIACNMCVVHVKCYVK